MRIGIDFHLAEREGTGNCTYMRNLVEALVRLSPENDFFLYITEPDNPYYRIFTGKKNVNLRYIGIKSPIGRILLMGMKTFEDNIDVLHVTYYGPPIHKGKLIVTIHDLSYHHIPEYFSYFERIKDEMLIPVFARKADCILTISEYSKRDIADSYHIPAGKIEVGYCGANPIFKPVSDKQRAAAMIEGYGVKMPYILYIGRLNRRKNLHVLVEAFNRIKSEKNSSDYPHSSPLSPRALPHCLVIVGKKDFLPQEELTLISSSPFKADIIFTGYVKDEHLPMLYSLADVFVYPSLFEGFGLPCLEAMSCGCPVVTSNTTSLPEVVGDAGILVDPNSATEIAGAMLNIIRDEQKSGMFKEKGLMRAAEFTWDKTALKFLDLCNGLH